MNMNMNMNNELDIIYSDSSIVVTNKPGGLLSIPGRGEDKKDSVTCRLKKLFHGSIEQPSVHRLDMFTSGLLVLALTKEAHRKLSIQFQNKKVFKHYTALLDGEVSGESGVIRLSFRLDPDNRPYQVYDPVQGKEGITEWKKIGIENGKTRILFTPLTGRTHQLRLHSSHQKGLGVPIIGDRLYGTGKEGDQMMLHASYLEFNHPEKGERISFSSLPPF